MCRTVIYATNVQLSYQSFITVSDIFIPIDFHLAAKVTAKLRFGSSFSPISIFARKQVKIANEANANLNMVVLSSQFIPFRKDERAPAQEIQSCRQSSLLPFLLMVIVISTRRKYFHNQLPERSETSITFRICISCVRSYFARGGTRFASNRKAIPLLGLHIYLETPYLKSALKLASFSPPAPLHCSLRPPPRIHAYAQRRSHLFSYSLQCVGFIRHHYRRIE